MRVVRDAGRVPAGVHRSRGRRRRRCSATAGSTWSGTWTRRGTSRCRCSRDRHGNVVHLGERDCSVQRRHQKVIEETPAPGLPAEQASSAIGEPRSGGARAAGYVGRRHVRVPASTRTAAFYFIEVNCRHPGGAPGDRDGDRRRPRARAAADRRRAAAARCQQDVVPRGAAIECRVNAEDPPATSCPTPGLVTEFTPPGGPFIRVDTHAEPGPRVTADYDSLLAKVVVWAPTRDEALARMDRALGEFRDRRAGAVHEPAVPARRARPPAVPARQAHHGAGRPNDVGAAVVKTIRLCANTW